jgi:hypothetical protein
MLVVIVGAWLTSLPEKQITTDQVPAH